MKKYIFLLLLSWIASCQSLSASASDVVFSSLSGPSGTLIAEQFYRYTCTIINYDQTYSHDIYIDYYYDGTYWGSYGYPIFLAAYHGVPVSFDLPVYYGNHTITFAVYADGTYLGARSFSGFWGGSPNLSFDGGVTFSPNTTVALTPITVGVTIQNTGVAPASSVYVDYWYDGQIGSTFGPFDLPAHTYMLLPVNHVDGIPEGGHTFQFSRPGWWSTPIVSRTFVGSPSLSFAGPIAFTPASPRAFQSCSMNALLQNTGNGSSGPRTVSVRVDGQFAGSFEVTLPAKSSTDLPFPMGWLLPGTHTFEYSVAGAAPVSASKYFPNGTPILVFNPIKFTPDSPMAFAPFTIEGRLDNIGDGMQTDVVIELYVDNNPIPAAVFNPITIYPDGQVTIPPISFDGMLPGSHVFEFKVRSSPTQTVSTKNFPNGTPDLNFSAITFDPVDPIAFQEFNCSTILSNTGNGQSNDVVVEVYLDDEQPPAEFEPITIYPGSSVTYSIPVVVLPGEHTLKCKVKNSSKEIVRSKNFANGTPDVQLTEGVTFTPANPDAFSQFTISATITNIGTGWQTNIYVDVAINDVPRYYFGPFTLLPDMGYTLPLTFMGAYPGDHKFKYQLRSNPAQNKETTKKFPVTIPPPLSLSVSSGQPDSVNVSWQKPGYAPAPDFTISQYNLYSRPSGASWRNPVLLDPSSSGGVALPAQTGLQDFGMKSIVQYNGREYQSEMSSSVQVEVHAVSPPPAPTGVQVSDPHSGNRLNISWNAASVPDLRCYFVIRKEGGAPTLHDHDADFYIPPSVTTFLDTGLLEGHHYYYAVVANSLEGGNSQPSQAVMGTPADTLAPAAPSGFTAFSALNGVVFSATLNWARPTQNTDGSELTDFQYYRLEFCDITTDGNWTLISETLSATHYYHELYGRGGHTLGYRLQALDDSGNASAYATTSVVMPEIDNPPAAPQNLTVFESAANDQSLVISWNASPESDVTSYKLYRKTANGSFGLLQTLNATSYNDRNVQVGTLYTYYVTAVDSIGQESTPGNQDSNTPKQKLLEIVSPTQLQPEQVFSWTGHGPVDIQWRIADRYRLLYPDGVVQMEIKDQNTGEIVYTVYESRPLSQGNQTCTSPWNGKHWRTGNYVTGGAHTTTLRLYNRKGGTLIAETTEIQNIVVVKIDLDTDTDNDGVIDSDNLNEDKFEEFAPGRILCVDGHGISANTDYLAEIKPAIIPALNTGKVKLQASSGGNCIKVWSDINKTSEVILPHSYDLGTESLPALLYVDGISAGKVMLDLSYEVNGSTVCADQVAMLVIPTISYAPASGSFAAQWQPCIYEFGDASDKIFRDEIDPIQGWSVVVFTDSNNHDNNLEQCTLANYKSLCQAGILNIDCHGSPSVTYPAYALDRSVLAQYEAEQGISAGWDPVKGYWVAAVSTQWLMANWAPDLNNNKAIVVWSSCNSADSSQGISVKEAAGGRWRIGYELVTYDDENIMVNRKFLQRLNGATDNARKRTAGEAWGKSSLEKDDYKWQRPAPPYDNGLFYRSVVMDGNDWTTLCPSPLAADEVWPPDQSNCGSRCGWGGILFDTYMNDSIPATDAIVKESGGPIRSHRWFGNAFGKFGLGFNFDKTSRANVKMRAVGDKCRNMDPSGGRCLDGDRVQPNSGALADDKAWEF